MVPQAPCAVQHCHNQGLARFRLERKARCGESSARSDSGRLPGRPNGRVVAIVTAAYSLRFSSARSSVDRASASGAEGRRFESCRARHFQGNGDPIKGAARTKFGRERQISKRPIAEGLKPLTGAWRWAFHPLPRISALYRTRASAHPRSPAGSASHARSSIAFWRQTQNPPVTRPIAYPAPPMRT